jgi:hypothetical protein
MHIVSPAACPRSLSDFDRDRSEAHRVSRLEEMRLELERRDRELFDAHTRDCPACGGRLLSKGLSEPTSFVCLAGRFEARVHRLRCTGCAETSYPIDSEVDRATRVLPSAAEHLVRLVVYAGSYERASEEASFHLGIETCSSTLHRLVVAEAPQVTDQLAAEAQRLMETGECPRQDADLTGKDLYMAIDGGHVAGRDKGSFEIKAVVAWSGVREVSKDRFELTDREGYAALEPAHVFFPKVVALAIRSGALTASRTIVVADGADWIRNGVRDWLPGALYVLDWTHLERRVREVLCRPEDEDVLIRVLDDLRRADPHAALEILHSWHPPRDDRRLYSRLLRYIRVNAEGIANHALVDIHGSGAIEKAVDLIISRRYKLRGMSWSEKGAAALLPFLVMRYNKTWKSHWDSRVGSLPIAA